LLLALKGQALQPPFAAENYSVAGNKLVGRHENKKLIAATNVRQLLALKNSSKKDVGELRQFINTFCSNVNSLKALNIEQPLEDIVLSLLLVELLDRRTNETGRRRLPITQGIKYIDGGEMSDFGNIKAFHQHC